MSRLAPSTPGLARAAAQAGASSTTHAGEGTEKPHATADSCRERELTPYEAKQIAAIQAWLEAPPSYAVRGYRQAKQAMRKALPQGVSDQLAEYVDAAGALFRRAIPIGAIEGAINANLWLAEQWADEGWVLQQLGAPGFGELADYDLERLDAVADSVQNRAIGFAGVAGGLAGAGGILMAAPMVPILINISMRTIRQVGLCYGYSATDQLERRFMLEVLALAGGGGDQAAKLSSATLLREMQVMVARTTWKSMAEKAAQDAVSKEGFLTALRAWARKIGVDLTKKRLLTAVPIVGGGVGLLLDGNYLREVGWTARYCYQRRWLGDRGLWPGP